MFIRWCPFDLFPPFSELLLDGLIVSISRTRNRSCLVLLITMFLFNWLFLYLLLRNFPKSSSNHISVASYGVLFAFICLYKIVFLFMVFLVGLHSVIIYIRLRI